MSTLALTGSAAAQPEIYRSESFSITPGSVRQGRFEAVAISRDSIVSTYPRSGREMHFRFSLNGVDNEFPSGTEHTLYVRPRQGRIVSPVYVFGEEQPPFIPTPEATEGSEEGTARVVISLDLRQVLRALERDGVYDPPQGPPIRRGELNAVYAIGDVEPLSWDSRVLRPGSPAQLQDPDGDGIYTLELQVEAQYTRPQDAAGRAVWRRTADLSGYPQMVSDQPLVDALYRMSLEELSQVVREDGALSAGAKWPGVWTRDVSYASVLALAMVAPDAVRKSLLAKVDSSGRIIQDTGTGGSWPISTDRMTWVLAAWELYAATGDREWLRTAHDIIRRSADADLHAVFEPGSGLVLGETSFMDWREQSYPRWMDPRDIAQSAAAGTNIVHFATYRILGDMARALGEPADRWDGVARGLGDAINRQLWLEDRGWYGSFRYGREHASLTPRTDALAQALAIIYGVADEGRAARIAAAMPVVEYGPPTFWPYIPGIPHYHNGALWPFVSAYWTWAAADARNTAAVEHGLASIYRPAALFLTNKENMVASTGHFDGTELNSDRQLWSVAGNLAASYRVLFGMRLRPDRLAFRPMVPPGYGGTRTLSGLRYRGATLDVTVRGHGNGIARVVVDGSPATAAEIPATLTGSHRIEIEMNGQWPRGAITRVANRFSPAAPEVALRGDTLRWQPVADAVAYRVYLNGQVHDEESATSTVIDRHYANLAEYQVAAVNGDGIESFLSEPIRVGREPTTAKPSGPLATEVTGYTGAGYLRLTREENREVLIEVHAPCAGEYALDARYANGSGPINTDAKAALRTVEVDGRPAGVLVMPQRGVERWDEWGWSTSVPLRLTMGRHSIRLRFDPLDENMDGRVNTALLDHLRLTLLSQHTRGIGPGACR